MYDQVDGVLKMDFLVSLTPMMAFCLPFAKKKYFTFTQLHMSVESTNPILKSANLLAPKLELNFWIP